MKPRVAIFTDEPGWHGAVLKAWLAAHGVVAEFVSLTTCHIDLDAVAGFAIAGFAGRLPDGAFVRGVPGGSLEAIVLRLDVLHHLHALGIPVFNSGRAIERTVDKAMTSLLLQHHGVPTPATFVSESLDAAMHYAERQLRNGKTLVKKPLFGSQGKGLRRICEPADLTYLMPGEVAYLQEFIATGDGPFRDVRVMVIDGVAIAAMERSSEHWITNRAQGGSCRALPLHEELAELATAAAQAVAVDYAGVDLLRATDGRWLVTEVNGIPAWQGLQLATAIDVTALLGAAFMRRLRCGVATIA